MVAFAFTFFTTGQLPADPTRGAPVADEETETLSSSSSSSIVVENTVDAVVRREPSYADDLSGSYTESTDVSYTRSSSGSASDSPVRDHADDRLDTRGTIRDPETMEFDDLDLSESHSYSYSDSS